jgi:signal transduction histidine kinase
MNSGRTDSLHFRMRQVRFPAEPPEHRLARTLDKRVEDLRGSRERIIAAADAERRRIERDLHDGAQQRMVAVAASHSSRAIPPARHS